MTTSIAIPRTALAAHRVADPESCRYAMANLEVRPVGNRLAVRATDGRRLVQLDWVPPAKDELAKHPAVKELGLDASASVSLPEPMYIEHAAAKVAEKRLKPRKKALEANAALGYVLADSEHVILHNGQRSESIGNRPVDGRYPPCDRVLGSLPSLSEYRRVTLDPSLLIGLLEAMREHITEPDENGRISVDLLVHSDPEKPVVISADRGNRGAVGILTPMAADDGRPTYLGPR